MIDNLLLGFGAALQWDHLLFIAGKAPLPENGKLPKGKQPSAKAMLHEIWMADTRQAASQAFDQAQRQLQRLNVPVEKVAHFGLSGGPTGSDAAAAGLVSFEFGPAAALS